MALVRIGRIGRAHGLAGEMTLEGASLTSEELLRVKSFVWRKRGLDERALTLERARPMNARVLVTFAEVADRDTAAGLGLGELWADEASLPDPGPGVAYTFQLVGMDVREEGGRSLGTLAEVFRTGANDVYVVRGERELLLPAIADVVRNVDMAARVITVRVPAGLEEL